MKRPQVLLADDHRLLTDALKSMLEPECEVVGAVFDGQSLLEEVERLHPDVVVLDISMPKLNGLDAAKKLKLRKAAPKLIFMTMNEDPYLVGEAFRSGASAFLLKRGAAFELTDAIGAVLRGGRHVCFARSRGRIDRNLPKEPQRSRSRAEAHSSPARSDSALGRGAEHEERGRHSPHYSPNGRLAQIRRDGSIANQEQRRTHPVRNQAGHHKRLETVVPAALC
jgi:DNA-binding NarL/FixJ family response regulator